MNICALLVLGGLAGWLASIIKGTNARMGLVANVATGIIGSMIGGWLFNLIGGRGVTGFNLYSLAVATVGGAGGTGFGEELSVRAVPAIAPRTARAARASRAGRGRRIGVVTGMLPRGLGRHKPGSRREPASDLEGSCGEWPCHWPSLVRDRGRSGLPVRTHGSECAVIL
ncbi:GlsB/YeaQ/YmgE family stress response membrane protein [Pyxidicoccus sp. 3LG]